MRFYEKYPQLAEKKYLTKLLTGTIFATMSLEDQEVPKSKVQEIITSLLQDIELKGNQFFSDKAL